MGNSQRKRERELPNGSQKTPLAVHLCKDVFLSGWQKTEALRRLPRHPKRPVEAVEKPTADFVLLQHERDGFFLWDRWLSRSPTLGVCRESFLELMREAEIVHDEPSRLVAEDAIDARDRLHQPVPAHRLV